MGTVGVDTLKVYDVLGSEVATLVNEDRPAGSYEVEFSAFGGASKSCKWSIFLSFTSWRLC